MLWTASKLPLKISILVWIDAEGALIIALGSVSQKWISQISTQGDPLGRQGVENSWGDGGSLTNYDVNIDIQGFNR